MSLIQVPGFSGIYVVDTDSGGVQRVGRSGGLRNPVSNKLGDSMNFNELGGPLGAAAADALSNYWNPRGGGGGGGGIEFEMPSFDFPKIEMSPEEKELLSLQIDQIKESNRIQGETLARENARRAAYNRVMGGEKWTPSNMEEQQGQLAAQAGRISQKEQDRLETALEGKLPVSPSTTRTINEGRTVLAERLRRNLGSDYAATEAGAKELARADESAAILEEADRKGYIERGITPAIQAGQYSADAIGQYQPQEVPGLTSALSGLRSDRQLAQNYATAQGQYALGLGQIASQFSLGEDQLAGQNMRFAQQQAADYIRQQQSNASKGGGFFGSGAGKFIGSLSGPLSYLALSERRNASSPSSAYGSGQGFS
jgi:hypothetical protein